MFWGTAPPWNKGCSKSVLMGDVHVLGYSFRLQQGMLEFCASGIFHVTWFAEHPICRAHGFDSPFVCAESPRLSERELPKSLVF